MALEILKSYHLKDETESGNNWTISFRREESDEQDDIVIGLHWNEKSVPTHEFRMSREDFVKMSSNL